MSRKITSMEELHGYTLRLLKFVDEVCHENNLTYFLSGGSALGAVRSGGFIPWDDDADIMFPREDYERFLHIMAEREASGKNSVYKCGSIHNRKDWSFPFARVWDSTTRIEYRNLNESPTGIFVDIYPMDGLPDSMRATKLHYYHIRACYICLNACIRKRFKPGEGFILPKKILGAAMRLIGSRRICAHVDKAAARRPFNKANFVGCAVLSHYMARERFDRKDFEYGKYVPFEDTQLPVPNGYHGYLSALYGDYMTPPSVENRESEHHMDIYAD